MAPDIVLRFSQAEISLLKQLIPVNELMSPFGQYEDEYSIRLFPRQYGEHTVYGPDIDIKYGIPYDDLVIMLGFMLIRLKLSEFGISNSMNALQYVKNECTVFSEEYRRTVEAYQDLLKSASVETLKIHQERFPTQGPKQLSLLH